MKTCPVCFSEIYEHALKCPHCLSFIKPRVNEGQFWGTCLMVGGMLIGIFGYIWYLAETNDLGLQFMNVGIFLAYLGFLVYGFGTFRGWIPKKKEQDEEEILTENKKRCFFCGELIDIRAIKCHHCYSYMRQEKGKMLAAFVIVSGILILTTAYILFLAQNLQAELYMQIGLYIIIAGILMFLVLAIKKRYTSAYH